MTTRRQFLLASAVGATYSHVVVAQTRPAKVGMLLARPLNESFYARGIVQRLGELGYREKAGMVLEHRSADGIAERFPKLARELIDARCDVIFAVGPEQAARALQNAAAPVVVFLAVDYDPLEKGIITSLSRPDRNTTGLYIPQGLLAAKRLEIMREILPGARRFLVLSDVFSKDLVPAVRSAAAAAGIQLTVIEFDRSPYDFVAAFEAARQAQVDGLIGIPSPVFATRGAEIGALLNQYRLPSAGWAASVIPAGFLFGYGEDTLKVSRRAAEVGAKILKGTKPSDIPVEQADEFVLVINATAARSLGVKVPESVLARATKIVQ